jgi:hypothetical protein
MQLTKRIRFYPPELPSGLFAVILLFISQFAYAQHTVKNIVYKKTDISCNENNREQYLAEKPNIVFPAILKGSEDEAMEYIESFSNRRKAYLVRMYKRGKTLLPNTAKILKKYNLPEELKMILPLESAYNAGAVSRAGAVGYWQIMDEVAREYGLKCAERGVKNKKGARKKVKARVRQKDDRMNFMKSTVTAARYLHARRLNLNDNWLLVVASYNCGVGNVWSAMKRTGKANPDFWDVKKYLPAETRTYVMNFITLNVIFSNYDNFIRNRLIFKPVKTKPAEDPCDNITDATVISDY